MSDTPQQTPPPEFAQLLINQSKELDLRRDQLTLQAQTDKNNFDYAKAVLAAEERDRCAQRDHSKHTGWQRYLFIIVLILIFFAFLAYVLHLGKEAIASEIIQAAIYLVVGGGAGYSARVIQTSRQSNKDSNNPQ